MRDRMMSRILLAIAYTTFLVALLWTSVPGVQAQAPSTQERVILRPGLSETRIAVRNTTMYPFSAIARIVSTFPNGEQSIGSGAFVGSNRVVTAGHMIYDSAAGGYAKHVEVTPGYANGVAPFGSTWASHMQTTQGYKNSSDPNFDFALLTTESHLGLYTGWLGFKATDNGDLNPVVLCGYPADLGGTRHMYVAGGQSRWENNHRLEYLFWTDSGMSGGPLFNYQYYVVGIHTGGNNNYNYGVSINQAWLSWF